MIEALTAIPVRLDAGSLMERAHIEPDSEDAATFLQLVALAREMAAPKALLAEAFVEERGEETVRIGGYTFTSRMLRANLDRVERVFPFVATCGHEMDLAPLPAEEFLAEFWWDEIKAAVLGCAFDSLHDHLRRRYLLDKSASMSPGSGDADVWPIEQQQALFALFGDVRALIGVQLTPSFLMVPNKTVSGICFPTETDFRSCQVCRREGCPNRAAPFDDALWHAIQHR